MRLEYGFFLINSINIYSLFPSTIQSVEGRTQYAFNIVEDCPFILMPSS